MRRTELGGSDVAGSVTVNNQKPQQVDPCGVDECGATNASSLSRRAVYHGDTNTYTRGRGPEDWENGRGPEDWENAVSNARLMPGKEREPECHPDLPPGPAARPSLSATRRGWVPRYISVHLHTYPIQEWRRGADTWGERRRTSTGHRLLTSLFSPPQVTGCSSAQVLNTAGPLVPHGPASCMLRGDAFQSSIHITKVWGYDGRGRNAPTHQTSHIHWQAATRRPEG